MPNLLQTIDTVHEIIGFAAMVLTATLALTLGRAPHRLCGLLVVLETLIFAVFIGFLDQEQRYLLYKMKAILLFIAYAALTWRWPDRWLILLAGLQGFATLIHMAAWVDPTIWIGANGLVLNAIGWSMLAVLAAASVGAAFTRRDAAHQAAAQSGLTLQDR